MKSGKGETKKSACVILFFLFSLSPCLRNKAYAWRCETIPLKLGWNKGKSKGLYVVHFRFVGWF